MRAKLVFPQYESMIELCTNVLSNLLYITYIHKSLCKSDRNYNLLKSCL